MTLEEAINELQNQCCVPNSVFMTPPYLARALGIEALRLLQHQRTYLLRAQETILPGETKE